MGGFFSQVSQWFGLNGGNDDGCGCGNNDDASDDQDLGQYFAEVVEKAQATLDNADVSNPTADVAICACITGDVEILKKMDANGFSQWSNPKIISNAVAFSDAGCCEFLLKKGANANIILDTDVKNFQKAPLLTVAVTAENMEICELLVSNGANVNATDKEGVTALFYAAIGGNLEICKFLVSHGADVNAGEITPLTAAQQEGNTDVINYLKSLGAR